MEVIQSLYCQTVGVTIPTPSMFTLSYCCMDISDPYSGGSADWVKDVAGIKYSYTVELRDKGQYGFILPLDFIPLVTDELWAGVRVLAKYASQVPVPQYPDTTQGEGATTETTTTRTTTTTDRVRGVSGEGTRLHVHVTTVLICGLLSSHSVSSASLIAIN